MLRKLNFTERKKIPRASVKISLRREHGVLAFDPVLSLPDVSAPLEARVFIEAYYGMSYQRFDCGTVGNLVIPSDRRLTEIESDNLVQFRLKIVDTASEHRIIAIADRIRVAEREPERASHVSLLPVNFTDLGEQIWRVRFEGEGPVLELTNRIPSIELLAKSDPLFFGLVYPAAVTEILTEILLVQEYDPTEESDEWWSLWVRWAMKHTTTPLPDGEDDVDARRAWIEEAVKGFCEHISIIEQIGKG